MVFNELSRSGFAALEKAVKVIRNPEPDPIAITDQVGLAMLDHAHKLSSKGDETVMLIQVHGEWSGIVTRTLMWGVDRFAQGPHIPLKTLTAEVITDDSGQETLGYSYFGTHGGITTSDLPVFEQLTGLSGFAQMSLDDQVRLLVDRSVSTTRTHEQIPQIKRGERIRKEDIIIDRLF